ncbi:MAG: hypothetical protein PVI03_01435 [Candidatus Thorarchaeota archaeon]|jgi:hypothetical protein
MPKLIRELKGDVSERALIKRWNVLRGERARKFAPLRIQLEQHEVEHRLMQIGLLKKIIEVSKAKKLM